MQGDLRDYTYVEQAVIGADAVVCVAGPASDSPRDLMAISAQHIVAAMRRHGVRRLVTIAGVGVVDPDDPPLTFSRRMLVDILEFFASSALQDSQRHADLVRGSELNWTILRPTRLRDDDGTAHVETSLAPMSASTSIARTDLARFIVNELDARQFVGRAPFVRS